MTQSTQKKCANLNAKKRLVNARYFRVNRLLHLEKISVLASEPWPAMSVKVKVGCVILKVVVYGWGGRINNFSSKY